MYDTYDEREEQRSQLWKVCLVVLCLLAFLVGTSIRAYNQMVEKAEDVNLAKSNVETMMQRRLELIPDLVATVKDFTEHEEQVFRDIANARAEVQNCLSNGNLQEIDQVNKELTVQIEKLNKIIVEDYPELESSQAYTALMDQLEGSASRIAVARQDYNDAVSAYNRTIKHFPTSIFAKILGFEEIEPFAADEAANQTNMVDFG